MIINEKYLMDIDDDDDNGITSDTTQHNSYAAHNIRIICEHNCREQNLNDWQFEYIDRFCDIVEEYFDSFDVRINFYDKEMQLIDGLTFSDTNPCDTSEYKSYINKKERHILVEYIISFHDINYISLGTFVIIITQLLKMLAIFHSHCLKPQYMNYSRLQHLYVDNIDIFNSQTNGKHSNQIMDITKPNWSLTDQESIWQHMDILRYAYREILGGSSNYTAKDIDRICKLWNNKIENLPRIIKYIYDVCDVKYSFIITNIYFSMRHNSVTIVPRNNGFGTKMDVKYSELYDVLAQGYIPNGRGTQKITVDTTSLQEFNLIYDSFDLMDKTCRTYRDVLLNIHYNADLIFDGINSYQLFYILSNLLRKTECTFVYIGNIINMPIGKELVYNPKISFTNHTYVENYKALDDSKYKVETERTNGTITNLKIKRIA